MSREDVNIQEAKLQANVLNALVLKHLLEVILFMYAKLSFSGIIPNLEKADGPIVG
jgi:hypothetical protein